MKKRCLSSKVTEKDVADACQDEYGVLYSPDGKRLLRCTDKQLTEYVVRDGVEVICNEAFDGCEALAKVSLPESLVSIGKLAFMGCEALAMVSLPEGLMSIGAGAFAWCEELTLLELPASLRRMDDNPFYHADNLQLTCKSPYFKIENNLLLQGKRLICIVGSPESVIIPSHITKVKSDALDCHRVKMLKMPDVLRCIERLTFSDRCLVWVDLPMNLTVIEPEAFAACIHLTTVIFHEGLTAIEDYAFDYCISLTSIALPDSVTMIGEGAFNRCHSLTSVKLPADLTSIEDYLFRDCERLTDISLPAGLVSIGEGAFSGCKRLTALDLPATLREIKGNPFAGDINLQLTCQSPFFKIENGLLMQGDRVITVIGNPL